MREHTFIIDYRLDGRSHAANVFAECSEQAIELVCSRLRSLGLKPDSEPCIAWPTGRQLDEIEREYAAECEAQERFVEALG